MTSIASTQFCQRAPVVETAGAAQVDPIELAGARTEVVGSKPMAVNLSPASAVASDAKTRGDVKRMRLDLEQAVAAGWVDTKSATALFQRLTQIDSTLTGMKLIAPATQKQVDQVAGDFFRLEFGTPGHVDSAKVMASLGSSLDQVIKKKLITDKPAGALREKLTSLGRGADSSSAWWVDSAKAVRLAIAQAAQSRS